MKDLLFREKDFVFPCRTGGILICSNSLLLQKPENIGSFPVKGSFYGYNDDSSQRENLIYQWVKLGHLDKIPIYPSQLVPHILNGNGEIFHLVSNRL